MKAHAAIRVDRCDGRTRLFELRSDPPLTVRSTPDPTRPDAARVHVVGSGAAPLGGDELQLDVEVGDGALLEVGAVAASLAQPDAARRESMLTVSASVGRGAELVWAGQPIVAVRGCSHHTFTTINLAEDASVLWREQLVTGRHDEPTGSVAQTLAVDVLGVGPLYRSTMALGPAWPGSLGPGGVGEGNRSAGSVLVAGSGAGQAVQLWASLVDDSGPGPVRAAVLQLDGSGVVLQAVSPLAGSLAAFLDQAVARLASGAMSIQ